MAGPVAGAAALTIVMNVAAGLIAARLSRFGSEAAAGIATTLLARGEFALILAALAISAGLDSRLSSFTAAYVLALAILGPILAGRAHWLARALTTAAIAPGHAGRQASASIADETASPDSQGTFPEALSRTRSADPPD